MEHEVYVPFSVGSVRAALAERERVAGCVPGLQVDAATGTGDFVEGRLRVRIQGASITYRGSLTLIPQGDGFTVEGSGTEARGSGTVKLALKLVPRVADDGEGTRLTCSGTVTGEGRIAEFEDKATASAGKRLLDRFCTALEESLRADATSGPKAGRDDEAAAEERGAGEPGEARIDAREASGLGEPDDNDRAIPGIPGPEKGDRDQARKEPPAEDAREADEAASDGGADGDPAAQEEEPSGGVFETDVPPSSLDPLSEEFGDELSDEDAASAEAAHARRTMIGRSAEEVDHAPPRGRYAPVPSPESTMASDALRWAAPAAAAVLAGAVVLTRALRRRR
jgi:carbon monoxide dehydrogenase subunit G